MDFIALGFYALVCGALSFAAPKLGRPFSRFVIGAGIGILAAAVLPIIKGILAGY